VFDPGHTNLLAGKLYYLDNEYRLHIVEDTFMQCKKRDYYKTSGIDDHKAKRDDWLRQFAPTFENLSRVSAKTTNRVQLRQHIDEYSTIYSLLWKEETKKRNRRWKFTVRTQKQSYLDKMARKLFHPAFGDRRPLVVMGSAKIQACIKGAGNPAPVEYVQKVLRRHTDVCYQSESRTSIICATCGSLLRICWSHGTDGYRAKIRGLTQCSGLYCRTNQCQTKNRDGNGSDGIAIRFVFNPARYQYTSDKVNLTKRRGWHHINHTNRDIEIENRMLFQIARSIREAEESGRLVYDEDEETWVENEVPSSKELDDEGASDDDEIMDVVPQSRRRITRESSVSSQSRGSSLLARGSTLSRSTRALLKFQKRFASHNQTGISNPNSKCFIIAIVAAIASSISCVVGYRAVRQITPS